MFWLVGVGLNSSGDWALSCWELVLHVWKEVRLLVELVGEGGGWSERTSLNWLFGVSWMLLMLSSCVWGCSNSISGEVIGSSM